MNLSRRLFLSGVCAVALFHAAPSKAWIHGNAIAIGTGWNTLPLGAGGLVTGMDIAPDGTMACRTDVGNGYRWSGTSSDYANASKRWVPLLTYAGLAGLGPGGGTPVLVEQTFLGMWEHRIAPSNSNVHIAVFNDLAGVSSKQWVYYGTWDGSKVTWSKSNLAFTSGSADSNGTYKEGNYKIAIDPANPDVAYCGMPFNSGNSAGAYTTLNQSGGSTLATWASVKTSGATPIPGVASAGVSCGLAFDPSSGTTVVGGQTVTSRIILPNAKDDIYETTDGGVTFVSTGAAAAFGTSSFYVGSGGFNAEGIYYCTVVSSTAFGLWRYASGTWTNITPASYNSSAYFSITTNLIIDPRNNPTSKAYLSIFGPSGISYGITSSNANTGSPPTWNSGNGSMQFIAPTGEIKYLEHLFGQGTEFCYGLKACVDANGTCFWSGNQSIWYFGTSAVNSSPLAALPNYGTATNWYSYSIGRGQETAVAVDMICPPGATYPILGPQDIGAPTRGGTFTTYPTNIAVPGKEYTVGSLEWAASDPSFILSCTTGQQNSGNVTAYRYSPDKGVNWNSIAQSPDSLWLPSALYQGQLVAVDPDHWLAVPSGFNGNYVPAYTANAMSTADWALTDLPSAKWTLRSWANGATSKPFAVGNGADLGTVWACLIVQGSTTATLYRSTDYGATFTAVGTFTVSASTTGVYCLSVPGFPDELWITATYTGATTTRLYHVTNARTGSPPTFTSITLPVSAPVPFALTLGAPATPGGYPTLYAILYNGFNTQRFIYRGTVSGSANSAAATVSWALHGATGTQADQPPVSQLYAPVAIRGDWNVYGRIFIATPGTGFSYYNP